MPEGSCLCGAVRYTVAAPFGEATACHCSQCRRQSGHYWASADVPRAALSLTGADALRWHHASAKARRGFCATCGSFLFWEPIAGQDRHRPGQRHRPDRRPPRPPHLRRRQGRLLRHRRRPAADALTAGSPVAGPLDRRGRRQRRPVRPPL